MVLIHEGVYHETIRPSGSGKSENNMLCFKGVEGEKVDVTGAEVLETSYRESGGWRCGGWYPDNSTTVNEFTDLEANVYMTEFPRGTFIDINPFAMANGLLYPW